MTAAAAPLRAGLVIFDGVEELDFVGPWEVLTMARSSGLPVEPMLVAASLDPVRCAKGMRVLPDVAFGDAPHLDIILVPGGQGTRTGVGDAALLGYIADAAGKAAWITSVCTGAALLGAAGVVDGRKLTTHWNAMPFVASHLSEGALVDDRRFVQDSNVLSAAGVSAGIDMTLYLVGLIWGEDAARTVQKYMEYYPEPPFGGVHPRLTR